MLIQGATAILTFAPLPIKGPEDHQVSCVSHGTLIQIVFLHFQPVPFSRLIRALEEARDQMRMDIGGWGSGALSAHPCWERTYKFQILQELHTNPSSRSRTDFPSH